MTLRHQDVTILPPIVEETHDDLAPFPEPLQGKRHNSVRTAIMSIIATIMPPIWCPKLCHRMPTPQPVAAYSPTSSTSHITSLSTLASTCSCNTRGELPTTMALDNQPHPICKPPDKTCRTLALASPAQHLRKPPDKNKPMWAETRPSPNALAELFKRKPSNKIAPFPPLWKVPDKLTANRTHAHACKPPVKLFRSKATNASRFRVCACKPPNKGLSATRQQLPPKHVPAMDDCFSQGVRLPMWLSPMITIQPWAAPQQASITADRWSQ